MSRQVKVTLKTDHQEVIQVDDDFELEAQLLNDEGWLVIPTIDGGEYGIPVQLVVAVVLEGKPKRATKSRASS